MIRIAIPLLCLCHLSHAFCGFYVAKADATLYNRASQVVLVREANRTALSMFNDYKGELTDFALVVPVPEVLKKEQINVGDRALFEHIDAYSSPRLVEYFDSDPCSPKIYMMGSAMNRGAAPQIGGSSKSLGVKIEAEYTIGEYDIVLLSAKESVGLESWLRENGYRIPANASKALEPYIKQDMKFFVAKVNLKEQAKTGFSFLRPIQFAFESPKYMLPIRLGMVNGEGFQDLIIYAITRRGRVETTNYRTVRLPSSVEVPNYIRGKFKEFYRAVFDSAYERENRKVVFQEYGWNMSWCDPCAADPLTNEELRKLGVFWIDEPNGKFRIQNGGTRNMILPPRQGVEAYLTRLHVRYDRDHFPEDLVFQETSDTENFQGRYIINHPWTGKSECPQATSYKKALPGRRRKEAENVARVTGWKIDTVLKEMGTDGDEAKEAATPKAWYEKIFK